jgi:hypothetical protein
LALPLLALPSLAVADAGKVKPEGAGADDESPEAAGAAAPKPPKLNPLLGLLSPAEVVLEAVAAAGAAAAPKLKPPVVTGALDDVLAAAAGVLSVNPPVVVDDDDDAGAPPPPPPNEKPFAPMAPVVVVVVVLAAPVPPVPVPPAPASRGSSQDAHTFSPFLLKVVHLSHFHLPAKCEPMADPPHPNAGPARTGTYRALHFSFVHSLSIPSFEVSHLVQVHRSPWTAASSTRLFLDLGPAVVSSSSPPFSAAAARMNG